MKKFSSFHRFLAFIICMLAFTFLSSQSIVFAEGPEAPSDIISSDNNGSLYMDYEICSRVYYNSRYVANCNGVNSVGFTLYDELLNSDTGEYTLYWRYAIDSSNIGPDKYVLIRRLTYLPPNTFVSSGDNIFFRLTSAHFNIYLGTAREFSMYNDNGNRYSYNMGGLNSYIWYSRWSNMFSCPDQTDEVCQMKFSWNTTTGLGSTFRIANSFTLPSGWNNFGGIDIINNMYDNNTESYEWTPYITNSVLYYIDTSNNLRYMNGDYYITFETNFDKTTDYFNLSDTNAGVNPNDAITIEKGYINDDLTSAGSNNSFLSGISIPISLPFSNWFALFTDQSCVDLTTIPSWFGLSSQHLCSPWNSTIRSTLTPIVSVASTMLLFGFIISYLRGRGDGSVIDSVKGTWYG